MRTGAGQNMLGGAGAHRTSDMYAKEVYTTTNAYGTNSMQPSTGGGVTKE